MSNVSLLPPTSDILLNITINLPNNTKDRIIVHKEDTPKALAQVFCHKHGLGKESKKRLVLEISQKMDEALMEEMNNSYFALKCTTLQEQINEESEEDSQMSIKVTKGLENTPILNENSLLTLSQMNNKSCTSISFKPKKLLIPIQKARQEQVNTLEENPLKVKSNLSLDMKKPKKVFCYNSKSTKSTKNILCTKRKISCGEINSSRTPKNHFEALYQHALLQREKKEKMRQKSKELKEIEEMKQATFRPTINQYKPLIKSKSSHKQTRCKPE